MTDLRFILVLLIVSAAVMFFLSSITWTRRIYAGRSAVWLSVCMIGVAIYNFGYAMELSNRTLPGMMLWVRFQHLGIEAIAPAWLLFSLCLTGREKLITRKRVMLLFIVPVFLFLASQTLGGLNLYHNNPLLDTSGPFPVFSYQKGPVALLAVAYYTFCITASTMLFAFMLFRSAPAFRKQGAVFLLGSLIPWTVMVLYMFEITAANFDFTPLAFSLSTLLFSFGFLKYGILDIVPLARDVIFEGIRDGVLILDSNNRIIDFNLYLQDKIPEVSKTTIGCPVFEVLADYPILLEQIRNDSPETVELNVDHDNENFFYKCQLSPLADWRKEIVGKIIVLSDFTQVRNLLRQLEKVAALDDLTGIYNRRHFEELANREIYRFQRYGGSLSMIMLDLDLFKTINDTYGHAAGDSVLVAAVKTFRENLRKTDIMGRFGGEEFIILLPETNLTAAAGLAEKLRQALENLVVRCRDKTFTVTASFGVSGVVSPDTATYEDLFSRVDNALYEAKESGRNRVCTRTS